MPQRNPQMKFDDAAITAANRTAEAGAVTGVVGWAASVNWIGWTGVLIALLGALANVYYQRRRDRRERAAIAAEERRRQELHDAQMAALHDRCDP